MVPDCLLQVTLTISHSFAPPKCFEIILKCRKCFAIQILAKYIVGDEPTAATLITTLKCLQATKHTKFSWSKLSALCATQKIFNFDYLKSFIYADASNVSNGEKSTQNIIQQQTQFSRRLSAFLNPQ